MVDQLEALARGEVTSRDLVEACLERRDRYDGELNAIVTRDDETAFEAADRADAARARGDALGALHGIPFTVKDAIATAGMRSTGGAHELRDHVPDTDAPAVARIRAAGGILLGKTNLPRWSSDIQTTNDLFGTTVNPWDARRTPGGSSGGAAAAVATGMTSFDIGTDLGGSIRIPAHFCGIAGHRPSAGLVSGQGYLSHVGAGGVDMDLNVFGPLARSARDLRLVLDVLAGPAPRDAGAWSVRLPEPRRSDGAWRIGVWTDDANAIVQDDVRACIRQAADALGQAGARVVEARPDFDAEESRQLCAEAVLAAISVGRDDGTDACAGGSHAEWLRRRARREELRQAWDRWFGDFDALLCPVMGVPAFPHDHEGSLADRSLMVDGASYTHRALAYAWNGPAGLVGLPSTVVPVGTTRDGLPVGVQIVGPHLEDATPLAIGAQLESLGFGYVEPPVTR